MARFDLTDVEWAVIEPVLPTNTRGVERVDDRRVLNGIFWRLRTGAPGPISRRGTGLTRRAATVSGVGARPKCGIAFSVQCQRLTTATSR
jgi:hypothetical protein